MYAFLSMKGSGKSMPNFVNYLPNFAGGVDFSKLSGYCKQKGTQVVEAAAKKEG